MGGLARAQQNAKAKAPLKVIFGSESFIGAITIANTNNSKADKS